MYELPTTIVVNDKEFHIRNKGDFRMVLDCFATIQDIKLEKEYRIYTCLLIFYEEFDELTQADKVDEDTAKLLVNKMFEFMNCGQSASPGSQQDAAVIDWEDDSQMIAAAINNVAKQEIRMLPYLHWWTFMGYYMSVGQSVLSTVVGIRNKVARHTKLEKWEQEFRRDNPQYFRHKQTEEERIADDLIRQIWNTGGEE